LETHVLHLTIQALQKSHSTVFYLKCRIDLHLISPTQMQALILMFTNLIQASQIFLNINEQSQSMNSKE